MRDNMNRQLFLKHSFHVLATAALALSGGFVAAQGYPSKPVKIIVPYPPGGTTDMIGRLIAQELQTRMGQPFIVDNRPGAAGNIGADAVAKSSPDGYTLLLAASNILTINPTLYKKMPFDAATAFAPVSNIATLPNVVIVNPANRYQIKTFNELISAAKRHPPGTLNYGSTGNGSLLHLIGSVLVKESGTTMTHIPYKGAAPMLQALYGNEIDFAIDNLPSSIPHIASGRIRPLAVTSKQRSPLMPEVPTTTELGYPSLNLTSWFGLVSPAGTDSLAIAALNKNVTAILNDKAVRERLIALGTQPAPGDAKDFGAFISAEAARWTPIVKASGATID